MYIITISVRPNNFFLIFISAIEDQIKRSFRNPKYSVSDRYLFLLPSIGSPLTEMKIEKFTNINTPVDQWNNLFNRGT